MKGCVVINVPERAEEGRSGPLDDAGDLPRIICVKIYGSALELCFSAKLGSSGRDEAASAAGLRMADNDLTRMLIDWPYEPGKVQVRLVEGEDGESRIQVRLDLGIIQMHSEGRPDGQRPRGFDSLLEYHETRLDEYTVEQGAAQGFTMTAEDCRDVKEEAAQFYRRYTALWVLEDFEGVVRDTSRNLRALDLLAKHAEADADRQEMELFRPFITMMRTRALAGSAVRDNEVKAALHAIDDGLEQLRSHYMSTGQEPGFDRSTEVATLRSMREALVPKLPVSQKADLRRRLDEALKSENYELAAILRDELKMLEA